MVHSGTTGPSRRVKFLEWFWSSKLDVNDGQGVNLIEYYNIVCNIYLHLTLPVYIGPDSTSKPGMSEKCNRAVQHTQS